MISVIQLLPKELRKELVYYCLEIAFVLKKTELFPVTDIESFVSKQQLAHYAAREGLLSLLKWARKQQCHWDVWVLRGAAQAGHLEILKWAKKKNGICDPWLFNYAIIGNRLNVLKWIYKNKLPWKEEIVCIEAASECSIKILKWTK